MRNVGLLDKQWKELHIITLQYAVDILKYDKNINCNLVVQLFHLLKRKYRV